MEYLLLHPFVTKLEEKPNFSCSEPFTLKPSNFYVCKMFLMHKQL